MDGNLLQYGHKGKGQAQIERLPGLRLVIKIGSIING